MKTNNLKDLSKLISTITANCVKYLTNSAKQIKVKITLSNGVFSCKMPEYFEDNNDKKNYYMPKQIIFDNEIPVTKEMESYFNTEFEKFSIRQEEIENQKNTLYNIILPDGHRLSEITNEYYQYDSILSNFYSKANINKYEIEYSLGIGYAQYVIEELNIDKQFQYKISYQVPAQFEAPHSQIARTGIYIQKNEFQKILEISENENDFSIITDTEVIKITCDVTDMNTSYIICEDDDKDYIGAEIIDIKRKEVNGDEAFIDVETSKGLLQFKCYSIHNGYYTNNFYVKSNFFYIETINF